MSEIKCVVWDLDNTIWDGVLSESQDVRLKEGIAETLHLLDSRGILLSIASKNEHNHAWSKLEEFGLDKFFLYPEIGWNAKSKSIARISENLRIGVDTLAFVDDQPYELDEVASVYPEVLCVNADYAGSLASDPRLIPRFQTRDSRRRRLMYLEDLKREEEEREFEGPEQAFLESLNLKLEVTECTEDDLERVAELTVRTHQLNSTGLTFTYGELSALLKSPQHRILTCELSDRYGSYGKIGICLIELTENHWRLKLLLLSCRVMSRGVGTVFLNFILQLAKTGAKKVLADFKQTPRNRIMYVTYRFAGFREIENDGRGNIVLESDVTLNAPIPRHIDILNRISEGAL